ncbi:uncharacterized protein LOC143276984 [Babylonia areolata]|uniref:uncharacterized protein LOC143276984 n=1 Tax=Babylonia areolata TaxID=304850 RepID=UPI003FD28816
MDRTPEVPQEPRISTNRSKSTRAVPRKKMQRTRSFTDALKEKYCSQEECQSDFIIDIVIRGRPKNNGPTSAELAHLRNVVLSNSRVSTGGLPDSGLPSLCPNVTDLDLSSNLLESWAELLPLLSQLPHLKFLNLSRNHITRHKEELWRWSTPLPKVENMVLNSTGVPLREVLALARLMPALRELHICCNYYRDLGSVEVAIKDGALSKLECLRLNENIITSWAEVWKLRDLPCLTQLILSENPLCDVFYSADCPDLDLSVCEMDSPDITCHSDGEDDSFGSPHFRYPVMRMTGTIGHRDNTNDNHPDSPQDLNPNHTHPCRRSSGNPETQSAPELSSVFHSARNQCHMIHDLIDDLITSVCRSKASVHESSEEDCGSENGAEVHDLDLEGCDAQGDAQPQFYLEGDEEEEEGECGKGKGDKGGRKEGGRGGACAGGDRCQEATSTAREGGQKHSAPGGGQGESTAERLPFASLHTLCLSRTSICDMEHLQALHQFPTLHSLRIMDIALFSHVNKEDRRKLYVASLPRVKMLNGSEVTSTERDKAERFYLRHFVEEDEKSVRYAELERKHGPVQPLFDIDLGARFQTHAALKIVLCGVEQGTETISLLQPVGKLRSLMAQKMALPRNSFRMFHHSCGPLQDPTDHAFDELFLDSLPLSRFDFLDGDELHIDFRTGESASPGLSKMSI